MDRKSNVRAKRPLLEDILDTGIKKTFRSLSLLPTTSVPSAKNLRTPAARNSFEIEKFERPLKRTPPTRSSNSSNRSLEEVKQPIAMTPSKVLLEHHEQLSEYEYKEVSGYPEIYYLGRVKKKLMDRFCDDRLYYRSFIGDHIAFRYEILQLLGDGSFGIVLHCFDHKTQSPVAVKILRKGKKFSKIGEAEAKLVERLSANGNEDLIVQKLDQFKFRGHFCIVFEMLSLDLYQYMKSIDFRGISMNIIKRIATQLVIALKNVHSSGLIHCDLKPENILFKAENKLSVKLIDFGSACEASQKLHTYIQSRFYRAPEVILESGYNEKIDIWSLGCILFELYKGVPLFQGLNEHEQLCRIVEVVGPTPQSLLDRSKRRLWYYDKDSNLRDFNKEIIKPAIKTLPGMIRNAERNFIDFLLQCFKMEPEERISAEQAVMHTWIQGNKRSRFVEVE